ncbi:hypothetical protein ANCCEY_02073 [Ancylostoma ceylanicum]|uniref:Uncharacterized protein n=1 Tax=Ancylostoma ceylanicum TaxID=53326 RepID=A0A0D6M3S8_9BILA|nr:hypothetical protein ANCCEY_02073 [Ancylostoma ceylanicum]
MTAANLLTLPHFTLISTWPQLTAKTREGFDEWLANRGFLWKERPCPSCGNPRKETARTLEVDEKSIVQRTQWFRDVLVDHYTTKVTLRIGGPDTVVQVEETHTVRRRYSVWNEARFRGDRSAAELDAVIQRHVIPGGVKSHNQQAKINSTTLRTKRDIRSYDYEYYDDMKNFRWLPNNRHAKRNRRSRHAEHGHVSDEDYEKKHDISSENNHNRHSPPLIVSFVSSANQLTALKQ